MSVPDPNEHALIRELLEKVKDLESRLEYVEKEVGAEQGFWPRRKKEKDTSTEELTNAEGSSAAIESRVGEYGLAWIGNIVLLFGVTFLTQYIQHLGYNLLSGSIAIISATLILFIAWYLRASFPYLSKIFLNTGQVLLFYSIAHLHYFTDDPLIGPIIPSVVVMFAFSLGFLVFWIIRENQWFAGMWMFFFLATAVISDMHYLILSSTVVASAISVFLFFRKKWWKLLNFTIISTYLVYILWLIHNPMMGGPAEILTDPGYGHFFLLSCGALFSLIVLKKQLEGMPSNVLVVSTVLNGVGFTFLLLLFIFTFFRDSYPMLLLAVTVFSLAFSVYLKSRGINILLSAFFALYSFMALSGGIYGLFELPTVFLFLSLESLLVLSIALWYRSRFIVVMNSILFVLLLIVYWASPGQLGGTNFSFAIVALATARILNWKKDRLEIKTDLLRNTYLVVGFIMVLYSLYEAMPGHLITLSWTAVAILYFVLSLILKNNKYRYMALGTFIATAFYLFIVDMARVEILFRVIAFLCVAIITIVVSLFYARRSRKKMATSTKQDPGVPAGE